MKPEIPLLAAFLCLGFTACAPDTDKATADPAGKPLPKGPTLVGRIASVPPDKHFVLVQRYGKWEGQSGQILTTRGPEDRTANLRTTGEKLGEFAAADIQSGTVEIGDAVYFQHIPTPVAPAPAAQDPATPSEITTDLPASVAAENVQKK